MRRISLLGRVAAILVAAAATGMTDAGSTAVTLTTGEILRGEILAPTDGRLRLRHAVFGELEIPIDLIASLQTTAPGPDDPSGSSPAGAAIELDVPAIEATVTGAPAATTDPPAPAPAETPAPVWNTRLEIGANGASGNQESVNARLALKTARVTPTSKTAIDASYIFATSNGDRAQNRASSGVKLDMPRRDTRWSMFAQGRYEYDEFNSWEHRLSAGAGLEYMLLDINRPQPEDPPLDRLDLALRLGGGVAQEFNSVNEEARPEAILGADLNWRITEAQSLVGATTYFPNLSESGQFRVVSSLDWRMKVKAEEGVSLKLGLAHEYQSEIAENARRNDVSLYGALVIDF